MYCKIFILFLSFPFIKIFAFFNKISILLSLCPFCNLLQIWKTNKTTITTFYVKDKSFWGLTKNGIKFQKCSKKKGTELAEHLHLSLYLPYLAGKLGFEILVWIESFQSFVHSIKLSAESFFTRTRTQIFWKGAGNYWWLRIPNMYYCKFIIF